MASSCTRSLSPEFCYPSSEGRHENSVIGNGDSSKLPLQELLDAFKFKRNCRQIAVRKIIGLRDELKQSNNELKRVTSELQQHNDELKQLREAHDSLARSYSDKQQVLCLVSAGFLSLRQQNAVLSSDSAHLADALDLSEAADISEACISLVPSLTKLTSEAMMAKDLARNPNISGVAAQSVYNVGCRVDAPASSLSDCLRHIFIARNTVFQDSNFQLDRAVIRRHKTKCPFLSVNRLVSDAAPSSPSVPAVPVQPPHLSFPVPPVAPVQPPHRLTPVPLPVVPIPSSVRVFNQLLAPAIVSIAASAFAGNPGASLTSAEGSGPTQPAVRSSTSSIAPGAPNALVLSFGHLINASPSSTCVNSPSSDHVVTPPPLVSSSIEASLIHVHASSNVAAGKKRVRDAGNVGGRSDNETLQFMVSTPESFSRT
ncbi:hypothetical protein BT96DRAFT_1025166 [Gymnopus androsaceus JB14]|uniref:Uncharacterized protein n=1 Tax=Gymnopus androsaceus JB14 TaxID=1447944 RepID=A0A6A4GTX1_9AGAR|nr:hypothetical protein BT96DRAFT_1025166 [Gymnopus androsaceus JB14]